MIYSCMLYSPPISSLQDTPGGANLHPCQVPVIALRCLMSNGTSNPYYGPDEDAATIFFERTFLAGDLLSGLGHGVELVLYAACARYLWSQRRSRRHALFLLAYITFVLCVQTIFIAVQARTVQLVYIDNRNYPGGPWAYFLSSQSLAVNVMFEATLFVNTFMCDGLVVSTLIFEPYLGF